MINRNGILDIITVYCIANQLKCIIEPMNSTFGLFANEKLNLLMSNGHKMYAKGIFISMDFPHLHMKERK